MKKHHIGAHVLLILFSIIAIFPILWIFSASINSSNSLINTSFKIIPDKPTLMNYKQIICDAPFLRWLGNSLILALSTTFLSIVLATTCAYAYSRMKFFGRDFGLTLFLILNAFPNILSIVAYFKILKTLNLLDNRLGLLLIYVGSQLIFSIWNLKGYFDTIPVEIEEAARIDGVNRFQLFYKIILPLSKPALVVTFLFAFMAGWNEYVFAMTFILTPDKFTLPVGLYSLTQDASAYATNWPLFAAGSLIVAIPVAVIFLAVQKQLVSGLTLGGVKG